MKKRIIASGILFGLMSAQTTTINAQGLRNQQGSMGLHGPVHLVLRNASLENNGQFTQDENAKLSFTGNASAVISGMNPLRLTTVIIDKAGSQLELEADIFVRKAINMKNGMLQLNNSVLDLEGTGEIINERSQSHITSNSGGLIRTALKLRGPLNEFNPGNIGIAITSNQIPSSIEIERRHDAILLPGRVSSIKRNYRIYTTGPAGIYGAVRFFYLDEELNGADEAGLMFWKESDAGNHWIEIGRDFNHSGFNWVYKDGIENINAVRLAGNSVSIARGKSNAENPSSISGLKIFPNPSRGSFVIEFNSREENANAIISIHDQGGKLVLKKKVSYKKGLNLLEFDLSNSPVGVYLISDEEGNLVGKLIKEE